MSKMELWFIRRIFKREVKQGDHHRKIKRLLVLLANEVKAEFTEDNRPTFEDFMHSCLSEALKDCDIPLTPHKFDADDQREKTCNESS